MHPPIEGLHDTENERFKRHNTRTVRLAVVVAVLSHAAAFVFIPTIHIKAYKLPPPEVVEVLDPEVDRLPRLPDAPPQPLPPKPSPEPVDPHPDPDAPELPPPPGEKPHIPDVLPGREPVDRNPFLVYDAPPVLVERVAPAYPRLAREGRIEGTVHVRVLVDAEGRVAEVGVVSSDVTPSMEESALEAARRCRFQPARQGSWTVRAWVVIPFSFILNR